MNRQNAWGPALLAPALILLIVFYLLPILYSVHLSLYHVGFVRDTWLGVQNYRNLATEGGYWGPLRVSAKIEVLYLSSTMVVAYSLALGLRKFSDRFRGAALTMYYVPTVFSGIVTLVAWRWIFRYPDGGLNSILGLLRLPSVAWLGQPTTAPWVIGVIMMGVAMGHATLLYVAAIGGINPELIEAAQIDGAGEWQIIRHIITPLTHRVRLYLFMVNLIGAFNVWEHPFFFTGGGPVGSTTTIMLKIYHKAFIENDLGMASAMTVVTVAVVLGLSMVVVRYLREFLG